MQILSMEYGSVTTDVGSKNTRIAEVSDLKGLVLLKVEQMNRDYWDSATDALIFTTACGRVFIMYHEQDCCEYVHIESITGNLEDLLGSELLRSEVSTNSDVAVEDASATWTFYKFATIKGYVDIRWHGESNGYYSEEVDFIEVLV